MKIRILVILLLVITSLSPTHSQDANSEASFDVPVTFATLGGSAPSAEVGRELKIDPAQASKQVSDLLLQALQDLGFAIESPPLSLTTFLEPDQQWQSDTVELSAKKVQAYNQEALHPLPSGSIYAVRYSGRYLYVTSALRMVLSISLLQRSQLGGFKEVSFNFSRQFFVTQLEDAVKAQLKK
ncbi:hypothetical protein D3C86_1072970 [compost metagenome]